MKLYQLLFIAGSILKHLYILKGMGQPG